MRLLSFLAFGGLLLLISACPEPASDSAVNESTNPQSAPEPIVDPAPEPEPVESYPAYPITEEPELACLTDPNSGNCIADLPAFPWPVPQPSAFKKFKESELVNIRRSTFGEMSDSLEKILEDSGYSEFKYYNLPQGIAMAAQLERIDEGGKPFPVPQRWDINDISLSLDNFSIGTFLKLLVGAEPGYYRVLVFVITDKNQVIIFDDAPESEQDIAALAQNGAAFLPEVIREVEYSDAFNLSLLVYEMQRKRSGVDAVMHKSGISAKQHLEYTNIVL